MTINLIDCKHPKTSRNPGLSPALRILVGGIALLIGVQVETGLGTAQQTSTASAPLFNANAKYVQGVGPGYWPTAGSGFTLKLSSGSSDCGSPPVLVNYGGGSLTLTASQTFYVYLDPGASCAPDFNTNGFLLGQIPIAKVTTGASAITNIIDGRNWFVPQPIGTDATGKGVAKYLNNIRFTDQFPLPSIANAITDAGTSTGALILVPPNVSQTEPVPGAGNAASSATGASTSPNVNVWDFRGGFSATAADPVGNTIDNMFNNYRAWNQWTANYSGSFGSTVNMNLVNTAIGQKAFDGGANLFTVAPAYFNKSFWIALDLEQYTLTPGQHIPLRIGAYNTSLGDTLGIFVDATSFGGRSTNGDEGTEGADILVHQGTDAWQGTISGTPVQGATSLTMTNPFAEYTQGAGRWLLDLSKPYSAGTISSIGNVSSPNGVGTQFPQYVGTTTSWTPSTAIATTDVAVPSPGSSVTITPANYQTGLNQNLTGVTTSTAIIVADGANYEVVKPTAVTATTFTATFQKPHPVGAIISINNAAACSAGTAAGCGGYYIELLSDRASASITGGTNPLKWVWPILAVTDATHLEIWYSTQGNVAAPYKGHGLSGTQSGQYILYPGAEVMSVQQSGSLSDTFTLAPNAVAWSNNDLVEEEEYPSFGGSGAVNVQTTKFFPSAGNNAPSSLAAYQMFGRGWTSIGSGGDDGILIQNSNDVTEYADYGGAAPGPFAPPLAALDIKGDWINPISVQIAPINTVPFYTGSVIYVGCPPTGDGTNTQSCARNVTYRVITNAGSQGTGGDLLTYNPATGIYTLSAGGNLQKYIFDPVSFSIPRNIVPTAAGVGDLGSTSLPFGNLWLGLSNSSNFKITGTPGGLRTQTLQDVTDTFVYRGSTDTLINKTLTAPVINGGITSTGAVSLTAGGTNQNVTLTPSGTGFTVLNGSVGIGTSTPALRLDVNGAMRSALNAVTFSATPTFDASLGNTQKITLTGNVTSSTLSNSQAGEQVNFILCQDATGSRTFVWPTNVKGGMTIGSTASKCSAQAFAFDGTNAYALSPGVANM